MYSYKLDARLLRGHFADGGPVLVLPAPCNRLVVVGFQKFGGGQGHAHIAGGAAGVEQLPLEGCRGAGSQSFAAHIWGITPAEYSRVADVWPHNPKGEITMGFKLENRRSVEVCDNILSTKGLAFAEPGPSDNGLSHLGWDAVRPDLTPAQRAASMTW